jgi:hypothetical protein
VAVHGESESESRGELVDRDAWSIRVRVLRERIGAVPNTATVTEINVAHTLVSKSDVKQKEKVAVWLQDQVFLMFRVAKWRVAKRRPVLSTLLLFSSPHP